MENFQQHILFQPNIQTNIKETAKLPLEEQLSKSEVSFILPLRYSSLTNTWTLHKNKQNKIENNPLLCAAHQLWEQKLKTGILFCPCRELLERTAIKFDAEYAVLHQKLPSKQLLLLMTTLDSKRSLTQLIVLYNFQDLFMFLLTFLPPF